MPRRRDSIAKKDKRVSTIATTAQKWITRAHAAVYRATSGKVAGRMMGSSVLLLTTTGRKTGKKRTTPLLYLEDGENLVIVASNGGAPRHPAWWLNLKVDPEPQVRVGDRTLRVRVEEAKGEEKRRLWARLVEMYPAYEDYQRRTTREIPVVILRPQRGTSGSNPVG
jgi:deazaflavin-dependent oxidoreductase (nitroreductase family)